MLVVSLVFLFKNIYTQNLIQNGSFENYTNPIDCGGGSFDNGSVFPTNHVLDYWHSYASPDYFNSVCPLGGVNVPNSYFGFNQSKTGNAYVGVGMYIKGGYGKEYIYQQLSQPLQSGKEYCLSFYVNRADRFTYAIKNIGALFSNNLPAVTNGYEINATPQVENTNGIITDSTNWTQIQGCFTANGGEKYIIIGNFTTNSNVDTLNINSINLVPGRENTSYYYIDDITLVEQTTVGVNELSFSNNISLYPNPATDFLNITIRTLKENTQIKIYNSLGELVLTENLTTQNSSLNTQHLPSGVYFLFVYSNKQILGASKFIKE